LCTETLHIEFLEVNDQMTESNIVKFNSQGTQATRK